MLDADAKIVDRRLRVGFIGLGTMGMPMASNLFKHGIFVEGWSRDPKKFLFWPTLDFTDKARTPKELAERSNVIVICVTDDQAVESVLFGENGVASVPRPGLTIVDTSTISPAKSREFAQRVESWADFLDAPVSGGEEGARNGTLSFMVGGKADVLERVRPILSTMGKTITHCGDHGAGLITKLANQMMCAVNLIGVASAIQFCRDSAVDSTTMIEATKHGAAASWQLEILGSKMVAKDFAPGFKVRHMLKDLELLANALDRLGLREPDIFETIRTAFHCLNEKVHAGDLGTQAIIKLFEK